MSRAIWLVFLLPLGSCGGGGSDSNACLILCNKVNSCNTAMGGTPAECATICRYGGALLPGLAPAPSCDDLAGQKTCIEAAVKNDCASYLSAAAACPKCAALDGSACTADGDCQKFQSSYRCDTSRPGGYCTAPCEKVDSDCSAVGPEACVVAKAPSFDSQAAGTQKWCLLGCTADASCRTSDGYSCKSIDPNSGFGVCDGP